jgi:hypothetical protein
MWKVYKSHSSLPFARQSISTSADEQSLNQESFTFQITQKAIIKTDSARETMKAIFNLD